MDAKGLLITGSIGLVGAGGIGYAGYQAISKKETKNIENALKKEGYTPITKDSIHLEKILVDYKKVTGTSQELKFNDFKGDDKDKKKAKDILLEYCQSTFNSYVSEEKLNKAKKWCVEPISVSSLLTNQKLQILSTTANDTTTKGKWDEKVKAYRGLGSDAKVFETLNIGEANTEVNEDHRKSIKDKCDATGKVLNHDEKYEENLKNFKGWCLAK